MKCRIDLFGSLRNEMFTRPVFPIWLHIAEISFWKKKKKKLLRYFDQTFWTIRQDPHPGLQGLVISGIIFPQVIDAYKVGKNRYSIRT